MAHISSTPYVHLIQVWSSHSREFYEHEAKWLLQNVGGRLRKESFRNSPDFGLSIIQCLFATEWFRSVKRGQGGVVILERKRGQMFFVIRLEDIPNIRRWSSQRRENNKILRLRSA